MLSARIYKNLGTLLHAPSILHSVKLAPLSAEKLNCRIFRLSPIGAGSLKLAAFLFVFTPLLMLLTGCGVNMRVSGDVVVPTITISASPTTVVSGASSVLTVAAANATQVTVTGSDGSSFNLQVAGGTQTLKPTVTTTYTATAAGAGGKALASLTITIASATAPPTPPIPVVPTVSILASPAVITAGDTTTLSVTASNATQVVITGTDSSKYILQATGGTQTITPSATTTYTVVAKGTGGSISATTTITVKPVTPMVRISAAPPSIIAGGSTTLTIVATNATQVVISGSDGKSYTLQAVGGTQLVSPSATTTYTVTATGTGGTKSASIIVVVAPPSAPTISIVANPTSITVGNTAILTMAATNATQVTITGSDNTTYTLQPTGGMQTVTPAATTTYTASATGAGGNAAASTVVTVTPAGSLQSIGHVVFMLQENHTFDNYFGMLNPYRKTNGWNIGDDGKIYNVDGIDDKLTTISNSSDDSKKSYSPFKFTSTCIDDLTSSWLESYGDVSRYDFTPNRPIAMDGFVHTAADYAANCKALGGTACSGTFSDLEGKRSMGYYDQGFLNYYYYMASQFAISDRWFSPLSSKSIPNRIATFTGGTTQGLVFDPGNDDHLSQLAIPSIFEELDQSKVSWKIYYTVTQGSCLGADDCAGGAAQYPAINLTYLQYSYQYLYENPSSAACVAPTQSSTIVGDKSGSFCIDATHIAPLLTYYTDLTNGTLPSFAFIEAGYGHNDEHPGSGQSILDGQQQVSTIVNSLMASPSWKDSVFFLAYDEGGGPYDHVPPVPGHSNDNTDPTVGSTPVSAIPDISTIAVKADSYIPCVPAGGTPTTHCDLVSNDPGANAADAPAMQGFAAQSGFRVPNMVVSPFSKKHYVSHIPMDHTAVIKFVETRFVTGSNNLTPHEAAQPNLLDFFDFAKTPWMAPPTPPTPITPTALGYDPCTPTSFGP